MIFSHDTIIIHVLGETLAFLGLDLESVTTNEAIADAMCYFRWRYGRHAQPLKKILLPWPEPWPSTLNDVQCHLRRLCYCISERNEVELLNLETGHRSIWTGGEMGSLRHVVLSDRYLVLVSVGM